MTVIWHEFPLLYDENTKHAKYCILEFHSEVISSRRLCNVVLNICFFGDYHLKNNANTSSSISYLVKLVQNEEHITTCLWRGNNQDNLKHTSNFQNSEVKLLLLTKLNI